jgi:gamma-glutamyltranspeptidase/glutathione hydrolase
MKFPTKISIVYISKSKPFPIPLTADFGVQMSHRIQLFLGTYYNFGSRNTHKKERNMKRQPKRLVLSWDSMLILLFILAIVLPASTLGKRPQETPGVPPGKVLPENAKAKQDAGPPSWTGKAFRKGVVATSEPLAAEIGARVLEAGGNAIDAAAAVQFVLNVIEPQSSGIGGGGFMMIYLAETGETFIVESREKAPASATPDMFAGVSFGVRSTSGYAVGVPGTLLGVATALENWGTISLEKALAPAIGIAENGFTVSSRLAGSTDNSRLKNECDGNPDNPYNIARSVFRPTGDPNACGEPLQEGDLLVQEDLAKTLRLIAEHGVSAFYDCDHPAGIARAIVATQKATRSSNPGGIGGMTCQDLAAYNVKLREPTIGNYRDYTLKSMSPPSSGGLTIVQMLKMLERFPMGDTSQGFGFGEFNTLNVMQEAMRLAFSDRSVWMGDSDFFDVPETGLISEEYIALRSNSCPAEDPDQGYFCIEVGRRIPGPPTPGGIIPGDPTPFDNGTIAALQLAALPLSDEEGKNTTHFSIVDKKGNIVSYTSTIESAWGTGLMVSGFGFLANNELTDFNSTPQMADGSGANDVLPGKRPRSSMAPSILFKGDTPIAAYGSPGGSSIINTVFQITLNLIDHGMKIQEAVDAPRISLNNPGEGRFTLVEPGYDESVLNSLNDLDYAFFETVIGSVQAIVIDLQTGKQYGAADARRIGGVVGLPRPQNNKR